MLVEPSDTDPVILSHPCSTDDDTASPLLTCWVYLNTTCLQRSRGYSLISVELISSSRTVEIYTEEEEYLATSRGVAALSEERCVFLFVCVCLITHYFVQRRASL